MRHAVASALLSLTALLGVVVQAQDHKPSFEVASVKENRAGVMRLDGRLVPGGRWGFRPGGYAAENAILKNIIMEAYEIHQQVLLAGGGGWIESARFDIEAKAPDSPDKHQVNVMLQSLLEDRFKLTVHRERKEIPVYFLEMVKSGFKESKITGPPNPEMRRFGGRGSFDRFPDSLALLLGRPVIDKTGITGSHNCSMEVPIDDYPRLPNAGGQVQVTAAVSTVIFGALEQQLGLKLESGKAPLDVLVIDHVERPSAN